MIVIIIVIIAINKHIINQHLQRIEANTDTSQAQTPYVAITIKQGIKTLKKTGNIRDYAVNKQMQSIGKYDEQITSQITKAIAVLIVKITSNIVISIARTINTPKTFAIAISITMIFNITTIVVVAITKHTTTLNRVTILIVHHHNQAISPDAKYFPLPSNATEVT